MEIKKCSVLVVDRPCSLELFHVSTEEPTSDSPPLELWECVRWATDRTVFPKKKSRNLAPKIRELGSPCYTATAKRVADRPMIVAGYRLADLLTRGCGQLGFQEASVPLRVFPKTYLHEGFLALS